MRKITAYLTAAVLTLAATSALAGPPPWSHGRGWHDHDSFRVGVYDDYYGYGYAPPVVVAPYPPVAYAPQPYPYAYPPADQQPVREFTDQSGQYCREYQSQINVGGKLRNTYGTACRQPDGSWKMMN